MELLPKSTSDFQKQDYWNHFFSTLDNDNFEWYGEYDELSDNLHKYIRPTDKLLVVGCGNSKLGPDLYSNGIKDQINVDISSVVLDQMRNLYPHINYMMQDVTKLDFKDGEFSCALDKGTFDALTPSNSSSEAKNEAEKCDLMLIEVERVIKNTGRFICISLLQPNVAQKLFNFFGKNGWIIRVIRCPNTDKKSSSFNFPVFMCIFTKLNLLGSNIKPVYEFELADKTLKRCTSIDEILQLVQEYQNVSQVKNSMRNLGFCTVPIEMKLQSSSSQKDRYTLFAVDIPRLLKNPVEKRYGVLIIPQGRESEYLFGSNEGRIHLAKDIGFSRLVIIHLHRGEQYESLQKVQSELKDHLAFFSPQSVLDSKIKAPIMTIAKDVGDRKVIYEGTSEISGPYVIEDVEVESSKIFRRLIFLNSSNLIQSEVELNIVKKRGSEFKHPIPLKLTSDYHIIMTISMGLLKEFFKLNENDMINGLLVGLGGGLLPTFLYNFFPNLKLTTVEIDKDMEKIATDYFGLPKTNERFQVIIDDGINFIQSTCSKYKLVLIDCDNKSNEKGLSCPPSSFLEPSFLEKLKDSLEDEGIAVINLVCRNPTLKKDYLKIIQDKFPKVLTYSLTEDVNTIVFCLNTTPHNKGNKKSISSALKQSLTTLNEKYKKQLTGNGTGGKKQTVKEKDQQALFHDIDLITTNFAILNT